MKRQFFDIEVSRGREKEKRKKYRRAIIDSINFQFRLEDIGFSRGIRKEAASKLDEREGGDRGRSVTLVYLGSSFLYLGRKKYQLLIES